MKGKIDKDGFLHIERAGEMVKQECINSMYFQIYMQNKTTSACNDGWADGTKYCGHKCPLFGEPIKKQNYTYANASPMNSERVLSGTGRTTLDICRTAWVFDEFADERQRQ